LPIANGLEFDAGYFHKNITDLILWNFNSITGKSMPDNISAAAVDGAEMSLTIRSFSGRLNTEVNYTHLNALNKSGLPGIDGKKIPYRPIDSANFISSLKIHMVMIALCANYSGRRFVDDQNKQELAPYMLVDGNFGIKPLVAGVQFDFMVSVKNVFDKKYLVVKDYPMPGRMWQVKVGMNI
jgi:outer membrane cobalamin receptor